MSEKIYQDHKLINGVQTTLLLAGMAGLLGFIGMLIAGKAGVLLAIGLGVGVMLFTPAASADFSMRMMRARPVSPYEAPDLTGLLRELAQRAGLSRPPRLFYLPSPDLNAFAVGSRGDTAIAVSDGLLRRLSPRELVGVMAHEISHLRNNDVRVMAMAALANRITSTLSMFGQILLLINLPLLLFSGQNIPWLLILALVLAPTVAGMLQLALSRTREFDADLSAAKLTGDPEGLAMALAKLERQRGGFFEQLFRPMRRDDAPNWLRTHPKTEERIGRLLSLRKSEPRESYSPFGRMSRVPEDRLPSWPFRAARPRRHVTVWPF